MERNRAVWTSLLLLLSLLAGMASGQNKLEHRTIIVNGRSGDITIFRVSGHSFVDLETLVHLFNGTITYEGNNIVLTFNSSTAPVPAAPNSPPATAMPPQAPPNALSQDFMTAAVQELGVLKDWRSVMAYGITRGVPGDGSRMVLAQNKATDALRMAQVAASTDADRSAFQLLQADFNNVNKWYKKLVEGRKNMTTGNYSMSQDPLKNDSDYQKIVACSDFLGQMIPSGTFSDDGSCQ